jgi:LysM repeat protein
MVEKYARFLAPLALAAVTVGVYVVIHDNLARRPAVRPPVQRAVTDTPRRAPTSHAAPRFYTVRSGDTLSQIAARTGVSISQLISLNKALASSPDSLQTGQRLRLPG